MTLKIPAPDLAAALKGAASIVESRNTLAILSMVRLSASGGKLELMTTNLDVEYRQTLTCEGDLEPCCVDAKKLRDMAVKAKSETMKMHLEGSILKINAKARWSVPSVPTDDFPTMPVDALCKPITFSPAPLVKRMLWAAKSSTVHSYLDGIFLNNNDGKVHFVATDSNVMVKMHTATKWPTKAPDVILASAFMKALPDIDGSIEWDASKARFTAGDVVVTGKTIDGTYPDYRRVAPPPCEPYAIDAEEFSAAIGRVREASDAQQRKLRITRQDGGVHVRIEGTSGFEGEETVQADCTEGFQCGVNADYLVNMLAAMDTDAVSIEHVEPMSPMLIKPVTQPAGVNFEGILMPMRI